MSLDDAVGNTFAFSLDVLDSSTYLNKNCSTGGEEFLFRIIMAGTDTGYPRSIQNIAKIIIEWKRKYNKFINIKIYEENKSMLCDANLFANENALSIDSTITVKRKKLIFIITISSYGCIPKYSAEVPLSKNEDEVEKKSFVEKRRDILAVDMKNLFQTGALSDVVLTDGENKIQAHKSILTARSSVFAKMFLHPMKENQENLVAIKDVRITVLRALLDYFYSGTAVISDYSMARDLYVAADKYDVTSLREICSKFFTAVHLENVLDTLLLADLYNDKKLKSTALNFIADDYCAVKALERWNSFKAENPSLTVEILSFALEQKN